MVLYGVQRGRFISLAFWLLIPDIIIVTDIFLQQNKKLGLISNVLVLSLGLESVRNYFLVFVFLWFIYRARDRIMRHTSSPVYLS